VFVQSVENSKTTLAVSEFFFFLQNFSPHNFSAKDNIIFHTYSKVSFPAISNNVIICLFRQCTTILARI
jgi:hypothetical protein